MHIASLLLLVLSAAFAGGGTAVGSPPVAPPDSVLADLRMGRYWHAARSLRDGGAATGAPADVLLLARAEAGWGNWPAVVSLLDGAEWLDAEDGGAGWFLLGRGLEDAGRWEPAASAYQRSALGEARGAGVDARVALARQARALAKLGNAEGALAAIDGIDDGAVRSWIAVELARGSAEAGDTATTVALLARIGAPSAASVAWRLDADARLAAHDTAGAASALQRKLETRRGEALAAARVDLGVLRLALGDSAAALELLRLGFDDAPTDAAGKAAVVLLRSSGGSDGASTLRLARALDRAGESADALVAYDRARRLLRAEGGELPEDARVERARLMGTVRARQQEALDEFRAIRETTQSERIGVRNLDVWTQLRRRMGMTEQVNTLRRWMIEEHPTSPQAADILWSRASAADSRGDEAGALALYTTIARDAGSYMRAGDARMRMGQIYLGRGDRAAAGDVFDQYLKDFPYGRHWDEAAYWSARAHLEAGDTATAVTRVDRIRDQDPTSYYAVVGAELLGHRYRMDLPEGEAPIEPAWLTEGLRRLDLLGGAGLDEGVQAEITELRGRARGSNPVMLRLGEALIDRGRTRAGIEVGWQLRADGQPWDLRLVEVVFPFPYREMVAREAEEWGVDPMLFAALIRQESAFEADIVSHAGAIGLMQVMPSTGSDLARTHGVADFRTESLRMADVNLHLGGAYFVEMTRRFSDLPLVLSAYNAGPTRARRWARLPEASDPPLFTERIPIVETQGYLKAVRRNLALYQVLYGQDQ